MHAFGGAKGSRTPDLLNAILKTADSLNFLIFRDVSEMRLQWALLDVCCFRGFPRACFLVFPRCFPGLYFKWAVMADGRITKRVIDGLEPQASEFAVWDSKMPGFGVRVRPTGAMSYVVVYRAGSGRGAPVRRYTIASVRKATPEAARRRAKALLGAVAHGHDPAA